MVRFDEPFDTDLFRSNKPDLRIEGLYRMRRSASNIVTSIGESVWTANQRATGAVNAPPHISSLPAEQQPKALVADEAARLAGAPLYGLDEAAATAAVTFGAQIPALAPGQAEQPPPGRIYAEVVDPPTSSGLLRWSSSVGYCSDGTPVIACHWGATAEGRWLSWWADARATVDAEERRGRFDGDQAQMYLRTIGPLAFTTLSLFLHVGPDAALPDQPSGPASCPTEPAHIVALLATVVASWALLTAPDAAHLITRGPTTAQAEKDREWGLEPRPATLVTEPINSLVLHRSLHDT
jgi:hypothetical protein